MGYLPQKESNNLDKLGTEPNECSLTVYLTCTNNTKAVAEMIHKEVGGELVALELVIRNIYYISNNVNNYFI